MLIIDPSLQVPEGPTRTEILDYQCINDNMAPVMTPFGPALAVLLGWGIRIEANGTGVPLVVNGVAYDVAIDYETCADSDYPFMMAHLYAMRHIYEGGFSTIRATPSAAKKLQEGLLPVVTKVWNDNPQMVTAKKLAEETATLQRLQGKAKEQQAVLRTVQTEIHETQKEIARLNKSF